MERPPQPQRDEQQRQAEAPMPVVNETTATPVAEHSWDERVICAGVEAAEREDRHIDDRTARYIASQLHGGQASALYALASSGAILDLAVGELVQERAV